VVAVAVGILVVADNGLAGNGLVVAAGIADNNLAEAPVDNIPCLTLGTIAEAARNTNELMNC